MARGGPATGSSKGLKGRDEETITANRILAEQHVLPLIGATKLTELTADDVDDWLDGLTAKLATRSLQGVHAILKRSIRQAQARNRVLRNVAELVTTPKGETGRPSKAMTLEQATAMLEQAHASRLHAYVVVSLLTGIRTEEARALRWSIVVATRSATRPGGGRSPRPDSITSGSRSTSGAQCGPTATPRPRSPAGRWNFPARPPTRSGNTGHGKRRSGWRQDRCGAIAPGLVFASQAGTPLDASHVRRSFKSITRKAGLGENWTPRELRHSFVSIMSDNGVPIETIADLVGHASTAVTEEVYRHQLKPVITKGAETMNTIFNQQNQAKSA